MDRLLTLYSSERTHPSPAEIVRNIILDYLRNDSEDVVRWTNPQMLEFQILDIGKLIEKYLRKLKKSQKSVTFPSILRGDNEGMKFFRKVPNKENTYRFHFLPRQLLPQIPKFTPFWRTETAV